MRLDLGLLLLRLATGGTMFMAHGLGKLQGFSQGAGMFPDPLGMGSTVTMAVAIFSEVACAILVAVGLSTRLATLPLIGTMLTAFSVVHASDPWKVKELAFLYLCGYSVIFLTGPGSFSLDGLFKLNKVARP